MSKLNNIFLTCLCLFFVSFIIRATHGARYVTFGQDQARDVFLMQRNVHDHIFLIGYGPKASVGNFYLPPFYYQLATFVSTVTGGYPLAMMWLILTIESLTPVVLFLWLRLVLKERSALIGALAYVISAGVIQYATFAWNPNMIPFFTTCAGFCWFLVLLRRTLWAIPVGCIALVIAISLHYQAIVLVPFAVTVCCVSVWKNRQSLLFWLVGGLLSFAIFTPYLVAEVQTHWQNTKQMLAFFHESNTRYFDKVSKPTFIVSFLPSLSERILLIYDTYFYVFGRMLFFFGFALTSWFVFLKKQRRLGWFLFYFVSIFVMLRVYKGDKVDYYMSTLYILPGFLIAVLAEWRMKCTLILVVCIAFVSGVFTFGRIPSNGLANIEDASHYIKQQVGSNSVRLLFQDQDFGNLFAFGLSRVGVHVNQSSEMVVDICAPNVPCAWNGHPACVFSPAHTRSVIEKTVSSYQQLGKLEVPDAFTVVIGTEKVNSVRATFPFYGTLGTAGSDTLLPQLYEKNIAP